MNFSKAVSSANSLEWKHAMEDEIDSMFKNNVWDLAELPTKCQLVRYKWIFKTKYTTQGKIERYKDKLVVEGYTQKEGIDYR